MAMLWGWITDLNNSKIAAVILFMTSFVCMVLYIFVFASKKKKKSYDDGRYIAVLDETDLTNLDANKKAFLEAQKKDSQPNADDKKAL